MLEYYIFKTNYSKPVKWLLIYLWNCNYFLFIYIWSLGIIPLPILIMIWILVSTIIIYYVRKIQNNYR